MADITLAVDAETVKKVRKLRCERDAPLSAMVRGLILKGVAAKQSLRATCRRMQGCGIGSCRGTVSAEVDTLTPDKYSRQDPRQYLEFWIRTSSGVYAHGNADMAEKTGRNRSQISLIRALHRT